MRWQVYGPCSFFITSAAHMYRMCIHQWRCGPLSSSSLPTLEQSSHAATHKLRTLEACSVYFTDDDTDSYLQIAISQRPIQSTCLQRVQSSSPFPPSVTFHDQVPVRVTYYRVRQLPRIKQTGSHFQTVFRPPRESQLTTLEELVQKTCCAYQ